jgi:glucuronokinase
VLRRFYCISPSDGFKGKTVSFSLRNFFATVELRPSQSIEIVPHPVHDKSSFDGLTELKSSVEVYGYYGGLRLIMATCKAFAGICLKAGLITRTEGKGFVLTYDTNIPRMVGLSGSSAIIVATFRGLLTHYGITVEELGITQEGRYTTTHSL